MATPCMNVPGEKNTPAVKKFHQTKTAQWPGWAAVKERKSSTIHHHSTTWFSVIDKCMLVVFVSNNRLLWNEQNYMNYFLVLVSATIIFQKTRTIPIFLWHYVSPSQILQKLCPEIIFSKYYRVLKYSTNYNAKWGINGWKQLIIVLNSTVVGDFY